MAGSEAKELRSGKILESLIAQKKITTTTDSNPKTSKRQREETNNLEDYNEHEIDSEIGVIDQELITRLGGIKKKIEKKDKLDPTEIASATFEFLFMFLPDIVDSSNNNKRLSGLRDFPEQTNRAFYKLHT